MGRASVEPEWTRGSRASARTKLSEVPETEEEEEGEDVDAEGAEEEEGSEVPPARKKSRRSLDDDEQTTRRPLSKGSSGQAVKEEQEEEMEALLTSNTRRSSAKPSSSRTAKTTRSRKPQVVESDIEEEQEKDIADEQQATVDEEDELDGFDQEYKGSPRRRKRQDANKNSSPTHVSMTPKRAPLVQEEEEYSLLEPRVRPPRQSLLPAVEVGDGPKTRLVIHTIVLINFKSYAARQEIGPFHKVRVAVFKSDASIFINRGQSFSSIVGPNGSGESNTIDALLFVFGYRAPKMRQGKISELIHNSARYPDLDECSVEVHFREIIDGTNPPSDVALRS